MNKTENMPAIEFKRFLQNYIKDTGVVVVEDGFKTGVQTKVQAMILGYEEEYSRPSLNSSTLQASLSISVNIFSESQETQVASLIKKIMSINGSTPGLPTYSIRSITPSNTSIVYVTESSIGQVNGSITIKIEYLLKV